MYLDSKDRILPSSTRRYSMPLLPSRGSISLAARTVVTQATRCGYGPMHAPFRVDRGHADRSTKRIVPTHDGALLMTGLMRRVALIAPAALTMSASSCSTVTGPLFPTVRRYAY